MASEQALAVRRVKAIEEQARQTAEVNRKLGLIMAHLKIKDPEAMSTNTPEETPKENDATGENS